MSSPSVRRERRELPARFFAPSSVEPWLARIVDGVDELAIASPD